MAVVHSGSRPAQALILPGGPIDTVLALDPGLRDVGLARLTRPAPAPLRTEGWRLAGAWWVRAAAPAARCKLCNTACEHASAPLQRTTMVSEILRHAGALSSSGLLIVEWPRVYQGPRGAYAPALLNLAAVIGGVAQSAALPTWQVEPDEWKGRHKKDVFQTWILACLQEHELALLPRGQVLGRYASDAVDAVGLGLWAVDRLSRWLSPPQRFAALVEPAADRPRRRSKKEPQQDLLLFSKEKPDAK